MVKHLPAMWETWVRYLGWEDPLAKETAIHSTTLAWKIPWTEEPGRLQSMGSQRVGHDWATSLTHMNNECLSLASTCQITRVSVREGRQLVHRVSSAVLCGKSYSCLDTICNSKSFIKNISKERTIQYPRKEDDLEFHQTWIRKMHDNAVPWRHKSEDRSWIWDLGVTGR